MNGVVSAFVLLTSVLLAASGEGAALDVPSVYPTWKTEWAAYPARGAAVLSAILASASLLALACLVAAWILLRSEGDERTGH
jgi:hypothetical protein